MFKTFDSLVDWLVMTNKPAGYMVYPYSSLDRRFRFAVIRMDFEDGHKVPMPVYWRVEGAKSGWDMGRPPGRLILFNLCGLEGAGRVYVTEGEKAASFVRGLGLVATTSAFGAGSPGLTDWSPLAGKEVIIFPDHDEEGRRYARKVKAILGEIFPAPTVRVVPLDLLWRTDRPMPDGGDFADWIDDGCPDDWDEARCKQEVEDVVAKVEPEAPQKGLVMGDGPVGRAVEMEVIVPEVKVPVPAVEDETPDTSHTMFYRAGLWMDSREPPAKGKSYNGANRDRHTWNTMLRLIRRGRYRDTENFGLSRGRALRLLREWNHRGTDPWDDDELQRKLDLALKGR
jgi:hypothetical protein